MHLFGFVIVFVITTLQLAEAQGKIAVYVYQRGFLQWKLGASSKYDNRDYSREPFHF